MLHRNLKWKLVALLLALCLWAYVTVSQRVGEKTFSTKIELPESPQGLAITSSPGTARVVLRGELEALETAAAQVQARAHLLSSRPGRARARVDPIYPPEFTLVRITPAEIILHLERVIEKTLPVTLQLIGKPSPGYTLGKPKFTPARALVSGAESAVDKVNRLMVKIDPSYATLGQPQSELLLAVDAAGKEVAGLRVDPQTVIVIIPVQSTIASRLVPVFVPLEGNPQEGYEARITVEPSLVTVAGEADKVKALMSVSTLPLSLGHASSSFRRRLALVVPEGVASISEKMVSVRVVITSLPSPPPRPGELAPPSPSPEE